MKPSISSQRALGLTLIELFAILAVIAVLAAVLIPALVRAKARAQRIGCVSHLKQIGLATRIWEGNTNLYPMQVSRTNGGTMDFITGPNVFRHFQIMSNELSTPKILICPAEADRLRAVASNFDFLSNSNISYFIGIDANDANPQMFLSGDRNITNGTPLKNAVLDLTTNKLAGWTGELHNGFGNFGFSDGSVQQVSDYGLRNAIANTGLATNRLQMPILAP
jgi:prepilin-type processing-associated H-X9-DG protein